MKRFLFILSAVLALQSGFASAADPKPVKAKCTSCADCKCADGFCPKRCVVAIAKNDLDAANAAVARGEKIVLCIGVPAVDGAYSCGSIKGYANGVYDCYREKGVHLMQIRPAYSVGNPFASPCASGNCPAPRRR